MIQEQKVLTYKGKVVFEKITMSYFHRIPKLFQKNEACFMFINQGEFSVRTPKEFMVFKKGKGLLAKCFDYFFETNEAQRSSSNSIELLGVLLYPSMMEELFQFDIAASNPKNNFTIKQLHIDKLLANYKESINLLLDNPSIADELLIKIKLKEFVLLLSKMENAQSELDFLAALFQPNSFDFRSTVKQNLFSNLSVEEFAKLCNTSISTFKRKFNEIYHESPKKYIAKMKLKKASQLLKSKDNRITDIAYNCGFDTLSTFNRNFKAHFGQSPSEYRLNQNE